MKGLLSFKSYYNRLIREIFEATEEGRKARHIAEEKAEAVLFYLNAYPPFTQQTKKEITECILSGNTEALKKQMERISDEHFTDRESLEEFLRLYESLDSGMPYEVRSQETVIKDGKTEPEISATVTSEMQGQQVPGQIVLPQSMPQQIVIPQPYPVWQMPYVPISDQGIRIVVSYALPSGLIERALFSPNNLNSALELFRNVNSTDVKIGVQVREHDLWMLEEKDGIRQDLFTETAFYQIGCSSPEVQLVRMIYDMITKAGSQ